MIYKTVLFSPGLAASHFVYSQKNSIKIKEIDEVVSRIDSIEKSQVNTGHFIVPQYSDNDTSRLYNRYILDTIKRDFYKCIYDCTFRGLEEITFYFTNKELIMVIVKEHEYNKPLVNVTYYFDRGSAIYKKGDMANDQKTLWDIDRIKATSRQYLINISGVLSCLDNRKK